MAVAGFKHEESEAIIRRQFDPPKRASLRAWFNAATKNIEGAPKFDPAFERSVTVDRSSIIFHNPRWSLFISRQGRFR